MSSTADTFNAAAQRLDELVQEFEALPYPAVREKIFEALGAVDVMHREAIGRIVALLCEPAHQPILLRAVQDPVIHALLQLYDLAANDDLPPEPRPITANNFVTLDQLAPIKRKLQQPVFREVARLDAVPHNGILHVQTDDLNILLARVSDDIYAVRAQCPGSVAPLQLGKFTPPIIVCPWHNEAWDIRTGKRSDGQTGAALTVLPVAVTDGIIRLAVSSESR